MKLLLLHGLGIISSRNKLSNLKKEFQDITVFEKGSDISQVLGSLVTMPLFENQRLIVLENAPEDFVLDSSLTTLNSSLVLWFDHEIDPKKYSGFEALFFPEAKEISVFPLLDFLAGKDAKAFLEVEKLKSAGFDIFYILTMVFYLLRNLVSTPKNAHEFVKKKLIKQRTNFTLEQIESLYQESLEIEFKLKSGLLDQSQAEFLLINSFIG